VKPIIQRALAQADIVRAFDHYLFEATADVARALVLEIEASLRSIAQFPGAGSPRYAAPLSIDNLRFVIVERFPYLVFYIDRDDRIEVLRVLHQHRDMPAILSLPFDDA
jgi:toxin ParE1/3/4